MSVMTGPIIEEGPKIEYVDGPWRFSGVAWKDYEAMLRIVAGTNVRVTYDDGEMEVVSPHHRHERTKTRLGRMVELLAYVLGIPMECLGSTTLKSEMKKKGLEPDECYYVQNEPLVRGREDLDLALDPPPDLAIEVDHASRSLPREPIYAALGVPELWCVRKGKFGVRLLGEDGRYHPSETSRCFLFLPMEEMGRFLDLKLPAGETAWAQEFAAWLRDTVAPLHRPEAKADEGP